MLEVGAGVGVVGVETGGVVREFAASFGDSDT
jgi:hypothetical protein